MNPETTTCYLCGQPVVVRHGVAYRLDIEGALHGCLAPDPEMPEVEGVTMVWDDATQTLVEA